MIYIVIGPSNSGKTTFVFNSFIFGKECKYYKDIIGITETDNAYLIGNWLLDTRVKGTDVVARQHIKYIAEQIEKLHELNSNKDIVIEGAKIYSRPLINRLLQNGYDLELYYIYCSLNTSIHRNLQYNPNSTATYRLYNWGYKVPKKLYLDYKDIIKSHFINTDNFSSFDEFKLLNINTIKDDDDSILYDVIGKRLFR